MSSARPTIATSKWKNDIGTNSSRFAPDDLSQPAGAPGAGLSEGKTPPE
jgi:hypothetical protein